MGTHPSHHANNNMPNEPSHHTPPVKRTISFSSLSDSSHVSPIQQSMANALTQDHPISRPTRKKKQSLLQYLTTTLGSGYTHLSCFIYKQYYISLQKVWNHLHPPRHDSHATHTDGYIHRNGFTYSPTPSVSSSSSSHSFIGSGNDPHHPSLVKILLHILNRACDGISWLLTPFARVLPRSWRLRVQYMMYLIKQQPLYRFYRYLILNSPSVLVSSFVINYVLPVLLDNAPWYVFMAFIIIITIIIIIIIQVSS